MTRRAVTTRGLAGAHDERPRGPVRPTERLRLSVVVCTHRRPELFGHLLLTLEDVWDDRADELIVVDDTPLDDEVPRVVASSPLDHQVLVVDGPGLSAARNRGWRAATGDVVVFFDDDSRPHAGTLAAYRRAFAADPNVAAAGGPLHLHWPGGDPPSWFSPALAAYFSGLEAPGASPADRVFGANMAIRRDVLSQLGGFATELGRRGPSLLSGEEGELLDRIAATGAEVAWVRDAAVTHLVQPDRVRRRWLLRRAVAQGRSDIRRQLLGGSAPSARATVTTVASLLGRGWGDLLGSRSDEPIAPRIARDAARRARRAGRVVEIVGHRRGPSASATGPPVS